MSVTGKTGVGIPVILLHDAEGGIVTIELKNGSLYTGTLDEAQDNMNCTLKVRLDTIHSISFIIKLEVRLFFIILYI